MERGRKPGLKLTGEHLRQLPDPALDYQWRTVTPELGRKKTGIMADLKREFQRTCDGPGWNPGIVQMGGFMVAVDYCADRHGNFHSYKTTLRMDHPFMRVLDGLGNAPRAVKHIYRADVRLRHLRAKDAWDALTDIIRAETAWAEYLAATEGK